MRPGTTASRTLERNSRPIMGWFDILDSFANGTLVDDAINGLEKGIDQFESLVGSGEEKLQSVVDSADTAIQSVTDKVDSASRAIDIVNDKINK